MEGCFVGLVLFWLRVARSGVGGEIVCAIVCVCDVCILVCAELCAMHARIP